ncbi:MAG: hypothetical protein M9933_18125 [Chitinophagaceae bacterium]|nr:hypothetical protein [Chitinophagaceae bacterium]
MKFRKAGACLLLFNFLNIMTFAPFSHLDGGYASVPSGAISNGEPAVYEYNQQELSTLLEFFLESVAGLTNNLPDYEQPDLNSLFIHPKNGGSTCFLQNFSLPPDIPDLQGFYIARQDFLIPPHAQTDLTPQYHDFIFRLTPF